MIDISEKEGAIFFRVRVIPRAAKSEIVGAFDGALKIRLAAPPVEGAANRELVKFLARICRVPKGSVAIIGGQTSRSKRMRIEDLGHAEFLKLLGRQST